MGVRRVRRRTGSSRDACVLVTARGTCEGLPPTGRVSPGTRWHARTPRPLEHAPERGRAPGPVDTAHRAEVDARWARRSGLLALGRVPS